jgi:AAA family ATP:ADP antiporter
LLVFAVLAFVGVAIAVPFYLWVGVYNYTSIAQFWGYASDVYTPEQGKRMFSVIGVGSSVGAVAGAHLAKLIVPLGPHALMLGAALLLGVCCGLLIWINSRIDAPVVDKSLTHDEPLSNESAFSLLVRDKFLILIAVLTLLINWCNSTGEYILDRTLLAAVASSAQHENAMVFVGQFKAEYFEWVNIAGVLLQLFAVSRILDKLGVRAALFFLPVVAFSGYTVMLVAPVLSLIRLAKAAENSIDYSVQNTARQALYLVATRVEKYVGKIAVDSFFVRFGDVLSAVVVYVGSKLLLPTQVFAAVNLVLILVWLFVVVLVGREHRRRSEELEKESAEHPPELSAAAT